MKLVLNFSRGEYDDYIEYNFSVEASSKKEIEDLIALAFLEYMESEYDWNKGRLTLQGFDIALSDLFFTQGPYEGQALYNLLTLDEFWEQNRV